MHSPQWMSSCTSSMQALRSTLCTVQPGLRLSTGRMGSFTAAARRTAARSRRISTSLASSTAVTPQPKTRGQVYLQGPFAPVKHELFKAELAVDGRIPLELNGVYIRNGPNPFFKPTASYHWFDGDGMLHACRIKDGKVTYCNKFIETSKLMQERAAGRAIVQKFGDLHGFSGLWVLMMDALQTNLGVIQKQMGIGNLNTSVVFVAKKVLATHEGDLPYQIRVLGDGMIESSKRLSLPSWKQNFTAHPKLNPETGQLYFFGCDTNKAPYLTYGRLTPEGRVDRIVPITLPRYTIMHDFAVTQRHAIFFDLPLCVDTEVMLKEDKLPMAFRPDLPARFGLLPLDARSEARIRWFDLPPCVIMHTVNAFELPNGLIKLYAGRFSTIDLNLGRYGTDDMPFLTEFTLDPSKGTVSSRKLSNVPSDFPVMNPSRTGRPSQYTWMAIMDSNDYVGQFRGIGKFKLDAPEGTDACVGRIDYELGWVGGEAAFVPRFEDPRQCAGEDDGFLLVYLTHTSRPIPSKLVVYDACTMAPQPLATVALPGRVPLGFHGLFVNETQLQASLAAVTPSPKAEGGTSGATAVTGREARRSATVPSPL